MLSCAVSKPQMAWLCIPQRRSAQVEQQLSLLEPLTTPGAVPGWNRLDETARTEAVRLLARLIAKAAVPTDEILAAAQEQSDE